MASHRCLGGLDVFLQIHDFDSPVQPTKTHLKLESNQNDEMSTLVRVSSCLQDAPLKNTTPAQTKTGTESVLAFTLSEYWRLTRPVPY